MKSKNILKEPKDAQIDKLKRRVRRLEKENARLKGEVKTLESYKDLTDRYLGEELKNIPVEDIIDAVKKKKTVPDVKKQFQLLCPKCLSHEYKEMDLGPKIMKSCLNCGYRDTVDNEKKSIN